MSFRNQWDRATLYLGRGARADARSRTNDALYSAARLRAAIADGNAEAAWLYAIHILSYRDGARAARARARLYGAL